MRLVEQRQQSNDLPETSLKHRILTVDDDLHIREVIRVALSKAGMTVF
jgi:PleD family two-component response regulator